MPPKPRPHGPRKRTDARKPLDRRLLLGLAGGGAAAIVVAVVLAVTLGGGDGGGSNGGGGSARAALEAAGCTLEIVPGVSPADHSIADPDGKSDKWNTDPPTSGPHNAQTAVYGLFDAPVPQASLLHNLEHGAIAVQYGSDVPDAAVAEIEAFYNDHRNGTVVAPLPRLGDQIALTAWNAPNPVEDGNGVIAKCTTFDQAAFSAFFDEYQFKGPERFDPDAMAPGAN